MRLMTTTMMKQMRTGDALSSSSLAPQVRWTDEWLETCFVSFRFVSYVRNMSEHFQIMEAKRSEAKRNEAKAKQSEAKRWVRAFWAPPKKVIVTGLSIWISAVTITSDSDAPSPLIRRNVVSPFIFVYRSRTYAYVRVSTRTYAYVRVRARTYVYVRVRTCTYAYIRV